MHTHTACILTYSLRKRGFWLLSHRSIGYTSDSYGRRKELPVVWGEKDRMKDAELAVNRDDYLRREGEKDPTSQA